MSVTLRTAIRLFKKDLSWSEFLLMTAGEKNAQQLLWKTMTFAGGLLLPGKRGNAAQFSRLAALVQQFYQGTSLAELLQQDMQQAPAGKSLLVDLASVMTGIDLSQHLEKQQWIQDAVKAIGNWHLSQDSDQLLMELSQLTAKRDGNVWWIAGIMLKGIMLFRLWQSYQSKEVDENLKKLLLKLMTNMPETWLPWVVELCDWLPVLMQVSRRRQQLPTLDENQSWLSWSRQMMVEAGQDDNPLVKKIMQWVGGYQQHWLMNLLQDAGYKNFAGLATNNPQSPGQSSADAMWGAMATVATQGRNLSHWVNQTVGSAKRVALPLGTLVFLSQIALANASDPMLSTFTSSGNSTLLPQEEGSEESSGYWSLLPALSMAGVSGLYQQFGGYFNALSTEPTTVDPKATDPKIHEKYAFEYELQEVNARLESSNDSWLPAVLLGGGLAGMVGGAAWAAHTYHQVKQPEQNADAMEMLTMRSSVDHSDDIEAHIDELSALHENKQDTESGGEQKGISTPGSARNKYIASGFMAGVGAVSAVAAGILYWRYRQDVQRKAELEKIIKFDLFEKSEFTVRVAKKLLELVGENFVNQAKDYDVRLAVEEVLLEDSKTEALSQSTTSRLRRVKRSVNNLPASGGIIAEDDNADQTNNIIETATDLSTDPLFIAALKTQLRATENDSGNGVRSYREFQKYSGWIFPLGEDLNKRAVGMFNALNYNIFPQDKYLLVKLKGANNITVYQQYFRPDDGYNTEDEYRKNLYGQINADIRKSTLSHLDKAIIVTVPFVNYFSKRPYISQDPDNSTRNFFVVAKNSAIQSADWSVVPSREKFASDELKTMSPWIRKTLQQKNDHYISQHYSAQESLKVDHAIGNVQYAESIINKIQDGINHSSGAYIDNFKAEISSFVGSLSVDSWSDEDEDYALLDEKVTYSYYESKHTGPLPGPLSNVYMINSDSEYKFRIKFPLNFSYAKKVTVNETFWEFLLKRRDLFNDSDGGVAPGGQKITIARSGTAIGSNDKIYEFEFKHFHNESIPKKIWDLINNDSYLRREGEEYVNKSFSDDKYRVYSNLLMDIYLANALDKVIAEGVTNSQPRRKQYADYANELRVGEGEVILLQHKNVVGGIATGDRLILIPSNHSGYYLAISLGAGEPLQKEIILTPYEDGLHVNDDVIDFLGEFFPENSLSKYRHVSTTDLRTPLSIMQTRNNKKEVWDKFFLKRTSNPLDELMAAHKQSRLDIISYIFESQKEYDAKARKRIYDDLLTAFTVLTFAIPVLEPFAIEMLALRGAAVEIINGIANVTARVLNVSSLGLGVMSSWEDYLSKKSRPKEALEAWSSFVNTLSISLLMTAVDFFPGMSETERYEKAVGRVEEDVAMSEASQIIENCRPTRDVFGNRCTIGSKKVADMATLYAAGNKMEGIDLSNGWNFVIDLQHKAKAISKKLNTTLKSTTRSTQFSNYLGKDPLRITSVERLSEIPAGARVAFTETSSASEEEIRHAMVSVGNKKVVGINNNWLTTRGATAEGSSASTIDLEHDITWGSDGLPRNQDNRPINIYAQSLHDLKNPEALDAIYENTNTYLAPERYTANSQLTRAEKVQLQENIALGEYHNSAIKANFLRGQGAVATLLPTGVDASIISNELGAVESMERLILSNEKRFYHGNSVPKRYAERMTKGDLLQSHQFTSFSDSQYVSRYFSELSNNEVKVIYEMKNMESGIVGKITPARDLYKRIEASYDPLGIKVQSEVMSAKEGIIPPGYVYRIKSVESIKLAEKPYLRVKLEYIQKDNKILRASFNSRRDDLIQDIPAS